MDGCVYRTKDGECDLYSEGGKFHAFCCNMNTCEGRKMTNYDRIVSKTPEELAVWLAQQEYRRPRFDGWLPLCNHVMGPRTCHKDGCEKCWLDWLKREAEEG